MKQQFMKDFSRAFASVAYRIEVEEKVESLACGKWDELTSVERIGIIRAYRNGERKRLKRICRIYTDSDLIFVFSDGNTTTKRNHEGTEI